MDLISREATIEALGERPENWTDTPAVIEAVRSYDNAIDALKSVPAVPAVPLDKLCLLLHDITGCPCYTQRGADMCNRLIGDQCNAEWNDVECWKLFLTKWMEGLDAAD